MFIGDTIAAISTARGKGGVALLRISGPDAVSICEKMFLPKSGKKLSEYAPRTAIFGSIYAPDDRGEWNEIDNGLATVFRAPASFMGEDTVEICCHGGILLTQTVLTACLAAGARAAEAGEFTRRAFLNGKMGLSAAEALGDLLEAKSESQLSLARGGMKGRLSKRMGELYDDLRRVLAGIYAVIDFPDEDLSEMSREEMESEIGRVAADLRRLADTYGTGRAVSEGIPTVICGRTNAGKSSVYNRILGYDAAIVTDVEGTTRDVLRETAILGKATLLLCDTAGLRNTDDKVESIGIERSLKEIEDAELVLAVFDGTRAPTDEDVSLAEKIDASGVASVALINKSDLCSAPYAELVSLCSSFGKTVSVSAANGEGFDALTAAVEELFIDGEIDIKNDAVVTGARQFAALNSCCELLCRALEDMRSGVSLDACCVGIECAMSALGEVDGREIGEEIVADIFSRFCVGK